MRQKHTDFWLFSLPDHVVMDIEKNLPDGCRVNNIDSLGSIIIDQQNPSGASILFFTPDTWKILKNEEYGDPAGRFNVQQVLVIDDHEQIREVDINEMGSFLGILLRPITRKALENLNDKAIDIQDIYTDLHLMAREITLERELLARKNMQLEFLNRILTRSSSSLNVEQIFAVASQEFSGLAGTGGLGAIFWKKNENTEINAEIYLPKINNKSHHTQWKDNLLAISKRFSGQDAVSYKEIELPGRSNIIHWPPHPLKQIVVPLYSNKHVFGTLIAAAAEPLKLGRDQLQIINSAGNHLALALINALKYRDLKQEADFDGLTKIYNRQQFDKRIRIELKRHQRHAKPLSLIMLDLDYFKNINDRYGHQAGDMVLKKIGSLLSETVRETDFPARFGGEEFVMILSETNEEQAWLLAERIRKKISRTTFAHEDYQFSITASMGIATINPGPLTPGDMLVLQADQALYMAKNSGRNMVCTSADLCVGEAVS